MTGYNPAFIIDNETKEALVDEDPRSAEIIKPVLRGRDIKRYQVQWSNLWLIMTLPSLRTDIETYPAIKRHLLLYGKNRLEQLGKTLLGGGKSRKKTPHKWFELQDTCAYHEEFQRNKIIYPETMRRAKYSKNEFPRFSMDFNKELMTDKTAFILVGEDLHYLTAFLNSKLAIFFISLYAYAWDDSGYLLQKFFVEQFPIPKINAIGKQPFIKLVNKIIVEKEKGGNTAALEAEIDQLVYAIYDLTDAEINIVESL